MLYAWFVQNHQHGDFGVVCRGKGDKGGDPQVVPAGSGLFCLLFRSAGFAGDAVAGHIGVFAGSLADHRLQNITHQIGGILGDHLPHHRRLRPLDDGAVGIQNLLDHIGLHQVAAVGHGGYRRNQLNRGNLKILPKAGGSQVHLVG